MVRRTQKDNSCPTQLMNSQNRFLYYQGFQMKLKLEDARKMIPPSHLPAKMLEKKNSAIVNLVRDDAEIDNNQQDLTWTLALLRRKL